jgi:hypothetical protein
MIDRWLQGYELAQRHTRFTARIFIAEKTRRTRKLCR